MKMSFKTKTLIAAMGFATSAMFSVTVNAVQVVDAGVPTYQKVNGISGWI